jgi:murein DD-endopeptidase MepM/ murein hydrolase activator NlpD
MFRTLPTALLCWLFLLARSHGQDVFVPRELKAIAVTQPVKNPPANSHGEKVQTAKTEPAKAPAVKEAPPKPRPEKVQTVKTEPAVNEAPADPRREKVKSAKTEPLKAPKLEKPPANPLPEKIQSVKAEPVSVPPLKESPANPRPDKVQSVKAEPVKTPVQEPPASSHAEVKSVRAEKKAPAAKEPVANLHTEKLQTAKKTEPVKAAAVKEPVGNLQAEKVQTAKTELVKAPAVKDPVVNLHAENVQTAKTKLAKAPPVKEPAARSHSEKAETVNTESGKAPAANETLANPHSEKAPTVKAEPVKASRAKEPASNPHSEKIQSVKAESVKTLAVKEPSANLPPEKIQSVKVEPVKTPPEQDPRVNVQLLNRRMETASTRLADGFDFPVGKPEAEGYYKARGFRSGGHMGEDWDGVRGGDTDFNDPIYCIGDGIVVFARDVHLGWGNVVIVRHAYRESGTVKHIDSLYGHLNSILVRRGQRVARGQQVGTMGTAHGQYDAHLHLEIRKNLEIGMSKSKFQKNLSNYYDPSQFIASHRHLSSGGENFRVAMNTFTQDSAFHFDDSPNFSARKRSTAQSAAALKRAISSTTR